MSNDKGNQALIRRRWRAHAFKKQIAGAFADSAGVDGSRNIQLFHDFRQSFRQIFRHFGDRQVERAVCLKELAPLVLNHADELRFRQTGEFTGSTIDVECGKSVCETLSRN